ncbi:MAG: hypothetical protein HRU19_22620 [Pseudobacteriovorax sp.]|nr:hypothetical protein [Pseudobacteriovorax sp.]
MRHLIWFAVLSLLILSCKDTQLNYRTENIEAKTTKFADSLLENLAIVDQSKSLQLTVKLQDMGKISQNPAAFFEFQDYILRKLETAHPDMSARVKVGVGFDLDREYKNLTQLFRQKRSKKGELSIRSIAENTDFIAAESAVAPGAVKYFSKFFKNLGLKSSTKESKRVVSTAAHKCRQKIHKKSQGRHFVISVDQSNYDAKVSKSLRSCLKIVNAKKASVNLVINADFAAKSF